MFEIFGHGTISELKLMVIIQNSNTKLFLNDPPEIKW